MKNFTSILGLMMLACFFSTAAMAQPDNNYCDDAEEIECDDPLDGTTVDGDAVSAPFCGGSVTASGAWYYWAGDGSYVTLSTCGAADFDTKLSLFSGDCGDLTCAGGNDDGPGCAGFTSEWTGLTFDGNDYYILVHGFGSAEGDFTLSITCAEAPEGEENSECDEAVEVECGDEADGSTIDASFDGVSFCGTSNTAPGVWFYFAGDGSVVTLSTCNAASYDTKISVYEGDCGSLSCVGGNDDGAGCSGFSSELDFVSIDGSDYYILVHGFGSSEGVFTLSIECEEIDAIDNEECDGAEEIECGGVVNASTEDAFTDETPFCGVSNTGPGLWYVFEGDGSCITATTANSSYDTKLTVFSGDCSLLACVDGDDDGGPGLTSEVQWTSVDGETYYLLVHGFGTAAGDFQLEVICAGAPSNDAACDAQALALGAGGAFDNSCATAEAGEINPGPGSGASSCDSNDGWCSFELDVDNSVWYTFVAPAGGCVSISVDVSADLQLAVYEVLDCADFGTYTAIAANDDGGASFAPEIKELSCLTPGATYYVQLDGFNGTQSIGNITVSDCGNAPLDASISGCTDVFSGAGALYQCTELTVNGTGGFSPYSIVWDNGATTATNVYCPDASGIASATVTDGNGCSVTVDIALTVTDVSCGSPSSSSSGSSSGSSAALSSNSSSSGSGSGSGSSSSSSVSCPSVSSGIHGKIEMCDTKGKTKCIPAGQLNKKLGSGWSLGACGSARGPECDLSDNGIADEGCACDSWVGALRLQYVGPNGADLFVINCGDTLASIPGATTGDLIDIYAPDSAKFNDRYVQVSDGLGGFITIDTKCPQAGSGSGSSAWDMSSSSSSSTPAGPVETIQGDRIYPYDVIGFVDQAGNRCNWPLCEDLTLTVTADNFGGETSYTLTDLTDGTVLTSAANGTVTSGSTVSFTDCVDPSHCYEFTINDSFGDGICCAFGTGGYSVSLGGTTVASPSGGSFGSTESVQIGNCGAAKSAGSELAGQQELAEIGAFPNPFRTATAIRFTVPQTGEVTVEVYSVTGTKVATLFNGVVEAGAMTSVQFFADNLTEGIYIYRLTNEHGLSQNGRLVLQR